MPVETIMTVVPVIRELWDYYMRKKRHTVVKAWQTTPLTKRYEIMRDYYSDLTDKMFSFKMRDGMTKTMPLLVLPEWFEIRGVSTERFVARHEQFNLSRQQGEFWEFFAQIQGPGWSDWDDDVFRPVSFEVNGGRLDLNLELCKFSEAFVCQYFLEHELLLSQISISRMTRIVRKPFAVRDRVAGDLDSILTFFRHHPARMGINNLILLKRDEMSYVPMVKRRGKLSMVHQPLFDAVSSCIFSVQTVPNEDRQLFHTVTREIAEELFGDNETERLTRYVNPKRHYTLDGVRDLLDLIDEGEADFHVTGFGIDLLRLVPEITTLLVVRNPEYYKQHSDPTSGRAEFKLNRELLPASEFTIPSGLQDAEAFLRDEVIRNPDEGTITKGFDPELWTVPAGFGFVQGIRRASEIGL